MIYKDVKTGDLYQWWGLAALYANGLLHNARLTLVRPEGVGLRRLYSKDVMAFVSHPVSIVAEVTFQCDHPQHDSDVSCVIYRGEDGQWWARPEYEFFDGRFEAFGSVPVAQRSE